MTKDFAAQCQHCNQPLHVWQTSRDCNCDEGYDTRFMLNAIIGGRMPETGTAEFSLLKFTGNQWNEKFGWDFDKLLTFSDGQLLALYEKLNGARPT